jgi:zinc D-Ala-D-Ala carboxypeptidase
MKKFLIYLFLTIQIIEVVNCQSMTSVEYIMGKFDPKKHQDFVEIPSKYADQQGRFMRKDALENYIKMADDALKSGVKLVIKSSTRNFDYQKAIWEKKWNGQTILEDGSKATAIQSPIDRSKKILNYSSMPGTSRHHWGTDIDLNNFTNEYFKKGKGKKEYDWLVANGHKYGYCQVYSIKDKSRPYGYNEEKWHWSYMPAANKILKSAKTTLTNEMITGFDGHQTATAIDMINKYVLGLNRGCNDQH